MASGEDFSVAGSACAGLSPDLSASAKGVAGDSAVTGATVSTVAVAGAVAGPLSSAAAVSVLPARGFFAGGASAGVVARVVVVRDAVFFAAVFRPADFSGAAPGVVSRIASGVSPYVSPGAGMDAREVFAVVFGEAAGMLSDVSVVFFLEATVFLAGVFAFTVLEGATGKLSEAGVAAAFFLPAGLVEVLVDFFGGDVVSA